MTIEGYEFGRIRIDGAEYDADVIVYPDRIDAAWRRKHGHRLVLDDLAGVLRQPPKILVLGTGYYGRMEVPQDTLEALHARGVQTHVARTAEAVDEFNRLQRRMVAVVAALHLTC